jgi:glycosyltransferase involved in cell wall biosynthesis
LRLLRALRRIRPDVIYQRVGCAYTGVAAHYARSAGCRLVWHVSSDRDVTPLPWRWTRHAPLQAMDKLLLEYGVRRADAVIVQNNQQAELLRRHYHREATALIPNFHRAPLRRSLPDERRVRVCWIANMKALKRPEHFVQLARDLAHRREVEFVMAGRPLPAPRERSALEALMAGLPNLRCLGAQAPEAIEDLLASSHLLVNTSDYEGFSNTFIQAWLHEVPVVSLRVNPDGVFDGEAYGICAHGSLPGLRDSVERLVADAELRRRIGARAREFAARSFSTANIDRLIRVLQPGLVSRETPSQSPCAES